MEATTIDSGANDDMEIKTTYLMWIGKDHYPTIEAYVTEAEALGISKRLPNAAVAQALTKEGTMVFLAHDEGNYEECPDCSGELENPEWRKALMEYTALAKVFSERQDALDTQLALDEKHPANADERVVKHLARLRDNARIKMSDAKRDLDSLDERIKGGTGGKAVIDGVEWDYRRYNYWLHQPSKWAPESHKVACEMCEGCGGTGRIPVGKVFGAFLPERLEYILAPGEGKAVQERMEAMGIKTVTAKSTKGETKRGCGYRKAGGVYAVTSSKEDKAATDAAIKSLVDGGHIKGDGATVSGNFIKLLDPINIPGTKRFRGIRRWALDTRLAAEAEMIAEAV